MLLAVDTSTRWVGLALYDGNQVLNETVWQSHDHHTVELAPALAVLFERAQITPANLQAIGVALGPGSFTSLRIGLGLSKGLALARHIPIVGIPTLDILAAAQPVGVMPMVAVLQAGRNRLGVVWYQPTPNGWQAQGEPKVVQAEELLNQISTPTLVCGELTPDQRHLFSHKRKLIYLASPAHSVRRPAFLAEMAWKRFEAGKVDDPVSLSPIYLHIAEGIPA